MSMVLNSRRLICGINPKTAKKICTICNGHLRSVQEIAQMLSISKITAESWLISLAKAGYLDAKIKNEKILWLCTPKGHISLATARFGKPLPGKEFADLLCSITQRAKEYNKNETFPLRIDKIYTFGSVFTQPWQIEDPNIAVTISEKYELNENPDWRVNYWRKREPDKHLSIIDQLYFAEEELARFLKRPKEHFSLYYQDISELSDEKDYCSLAIT